MEKTIQNQKGITLISLVVTIIVLLILTSVAIGALNGNRGITTQAKEAKKAALIADIKEDVQRKIMELEMENLNESVTADELVGILETKGTLDDTTNVLTATLTVTVEDSTYEIPVSDIFDGELLEE